MMRISPRHLDVDPRLKDTIPAVYERLDVAVGQLIQEANAEVVCICSDHGFGGVWNHRTVFKPFFRRKVAPIYPSRCAQTRPIA